MLSGDLHRLDCAEERMTRIGVSVVLCVLLAASTRAQQWRSAEPPDWVYGVTRMAFAAPSDIEHVAASGGQVLHTNLIWPYYPLRRDGGGLSEADAAKLRALVEAGRKSKV